MTDSRVWNADLELRPFPRILVERVLSAGLVTSVRKRWPPDDAFQPYSDGHNRKLGDPGRFGFYVMGHSAAERAKALDAERRVFWKKFARETLKPLACATFVKMFAGVQARFGDVAALDFETFAVLVDANHRLDVGVHTDMPAFVVSMVIYVDDVDGECGGTSIYTPLDPNFQHPGRNFLERSLFRVVDTYPCRAGSMMAMLCTGNSYHGVEPLEVSDSRPRRTINLHIRLTPQCIERLYGAQNLAGFTYPISVEQHVLQALDKWREVRDFMAVRPSAADIEVIDRSFLYGNERL